MENSLKREGKEKVASPIPIIGLKEGYNNMKINEKLVRGMEKLKY